MSSDRIHYLLEQLIRHACTPEEKEELTLWIDTLRDGEVWKSHLESIWNDYRADTRMDAAAADAILEEIIKHDPGMTASDGRGALRMAFKKWWMAAAIAVLGVLSLAAYLYGRPERNKTVLADSAAPKKNTISPGGNKAVLTLWNGTRVYLSKIAIGAHVAPAMPQAVKLGGGLLAFTQAFPSKSSAVEMNTVSTPRGGEYQVILPDGSKVWLNAESSVTFPSAFAARDRKVSVSGEAYFEIAADAARPFLVSVMSPEARKEGTVRVLGTRFNINAYEDESTIKTTLLEGAVKVSGDNDSQVLAPGEQAEFRGGEAVHIIRNADVREAVAWKNGLFDFEGSDIQNVMRRIARWYDVTVVYRNTTSAHFMGTISRNVDISEVLKMLEMTGEVHFEVTGKTITVLP